ncbi:hypothetical protein QFZ81_000226 [Paenibacillus sp. V4I9]|uniref:hypothetical protein n=1 Tax=Paenibacillus sp. V4I9 TaxID=3042308 RepID=UPI0027844596|nr:hypothetical protein [Paenibacillus sp. V4I9]MDQ0885138.1 hypothetical protein [Paenibacillus sp. V4I9]
MTDKKTITLRIENKTNHETVNFVLDTNTIRFKNGASNEQDRIEAVREFFNYTDQHKEVYNFVIPWQVGSELRLFMYRFREQFKNDPALLKQADDVDKFIKEFEEVDCEADKHQEEEIRLIFEYLKLNYEFISDEDEGTKIKMNSLKTDDARILLTALQEDRSIITHNVKDFVPALVFEKAIWDPVNDKIYRLSVEDEKLLKEDQDLQKWIEHLLSKFNAEVSQEEEEEILKKMQ